MSCMELVIAVTAGPAGGTGSASEPSVAFLLASFALIAGAVLFFTLEIFVPSGGLFGALCATCSIGSVIVMFLHNPILGVILMTLYVVVGPFAIYWGIKIWENSPVGRKLILDAELDSASAETTGGLESPSGIQATRSDLIGREGIADSQLRPVGFVQIDGARLDAIAEGDLIEVGARVRIVDASDNQLKVRLIEDGPEDPKNC